MTNKLMEYLLPRDLIAIVTLAGGFWLMAQGIDHSVGSLLMAVVMFYFGAESLEKRKRCPNPKQMDYNK